MQQESRRGVRRRQESLWKQLAKHSSLMFPKQNCTTYSLSFNGFSSVDFSVLSASGRVAYVPRDRQQSCSLLSLASPCIQLPRWLPTLEELGCSQLFPIFNPLLCLSPPFFLMRGQDLPISSQKDPPFMILRKKVMITADRDELFLHNCQKSLPRKIYLSNFLFGRFQAQLNSPLQILSRSFNPKAFEQPLPTGYAPYFVCQGSLALTGH